MIQTKLDRPNIALNVNALMATPARVTKHTITFFLPRRSLVGCQGDKCIMGQERSFRRRREGAFCIKGKSYTSALTSKPCGCTERDFNWSVPPRTSL